MSMAVDVFEFALVSVYLTDNKVTTDELSTFLV